MYFRRVWISFTFTKEYISYLKRRGVWIVLEFFFKMSGGFEVGLEGGLGNWGIDLELFLRSKYVVFMEIKCFCCCRCCIREVGDWIGSIRSFSLFVNFSV